MQFLLIALDGTDSEALDRRLGARSAHLENIEKLHGEGKHLFGGAILDDGKMIGSMMVVDYPSKEIMESEWLASEPYVVGNVWQNIEIKPCAIAQVFIKNNK